MLHCPICSQECPAMICTVCGYDNSTDYEQFGSLCETNSGIRSRSALKTERNTNIDNLMLCKDCNGYFFSVTKDGKSLFCHKCGSLTPHPVWEALENRIAVFESKIASMLSSDKSSLATKNTHSLSVDTNVKHIPEGSSDVPTVTSSCKNEVSHKPSVLSAGRACAILKYGDKLYLWKTQDMPTYHPIPQDIVDASAGYGHGVFLLEDGKVIATGSSVEGQCRVEHWSDLKAVSAGGAHTVGLKHNGRVVAVGRDYEQQCHTDAWRDVVQISAGGWHTLGLLKNKRVVATGNLLACDGVGDWKDVVAVSAGDSHSLGLLDNGKVVATGRKSDGRCKVEQWENIIQISAGKAHSVGLKKDGTVVATGENKYGECNVEQWKSIIAVSAGDSYTIGVGTDGQLYVCGNGKLADKIRESPTPIGTKKEELLPIPSLEMDHYRVRMGPYHAARILPNGYVVTKGDNTKGQCRLYNRTRWSNVSSLALGEHCTVGLTNSGTILFAGQAEKDYSKLKTLQDVASVSVGEHHILCLHLDGSVTAVGANQFLQCDVRDWKNVVRVEARGNRSYALLSDGTVEAAGENTYGQCNVDEWKNIVALATGRNHTVALTTNKRVLAVGDHSEGQCDVADWTNVVTVAAGSDFTAGLRKNGTVYATGTKKDAVANWSEVIQLAVGESFVVGLRKNGTVLYAGNSDDMANEIRQWRGIRRLLANPTCVLGLSKFGSYVGAGNVLYEEETNFTLDFRNERGF